MHAHCAKELALLSAMHTRLHSLAESSLHMKRSPILTIRDPNCPRSQNGRPARRAERALVSAV